MKEKEKKNMKIKKLEIANFRNIVHAAYTMSDVSIIGGKNHTGKTNTLQAPCWLLSEKLIDNSSNDQSLKPLSDTAKVVSVKITFDDAAGQEHTIEKNYKERWTKKQGSGELVLTGHDTNYKIDDIKQEKVTTARSEINKMLGIKPEEFNHVKDFNIYQAVMNPLYLAGILDWKSLRSLIIGIIGDVTPADIFSKNDATEPAKEMLERYGYDVDKVATYCTQQLTAIEKSINDMDAQRQILEQVDDLSAEERKSIEAQIDELRNENDELAKQGNEENPILKAKKKEAESLRLQIVEKYNAEEKAFNDKMALRNKEKYEYLDRKQAASNAVNETKRLKRECEFEIQSIASRIEIKEGMLKDAKNKREKMIEEYYKITAETFQAPEDIKCPNCGQVLNADDIEEKRIQWERDHQRKVDENIANGRSQKLKIEGIEKDLEEMRVAKVKVEETLPAYDEAISHAEGELNAATEKYTNYMQMNGSAAVFEPSNDYKQLSKRLEELKAEIITMESTPAPGEEERKKKVTENNNKIENLKEQEGKHYVYLDAQKKLAMKNAEIKAVSQEKVKLQIIKEAAVLFNKTKLDILESRIRAHFGEEIKWVLLENNIKEGSWTTTCYPMIIGTDTPYIMGSTSERVVTGIKIIESIKKELHLPDLPILVDEIGELDSESINKLSNITTAQIIATKVDDNYTTPTITRG